MIPHRPRLRLRDGAGGGAEADGDLLRRRPTRSAGADLLHGPLATVDRPEPPVRRGGPRRRRRHRDAAGAGADERAYADLLVLGGPQAVGYGTVSYPLEPLPEDLAPIADIVPLQWLALEMALARGFDPDAPRGLAKVTRTL